MKSWGLTVLLTFIVACRLYAVEDEPFVVHEWGVMIRSTVQINNEPDNKRALLAPPNELLSGSPSFVRRHVNRPVRQSRDWDKPVIHFYGPEGLKVQARVLTPHGRPMAYFPSAKLLEETFWNMGNGVTEVVGMQWDLQLSKHASGTEPKVDAGHWWNAARAIPSMYVQTNEGSERFLFWEAYAIQEPFITGAIEDATLELKNGYEQPSGPVLVLVNNGSKERGWALLKDIPAKGSVKVSRDEIGKAAGGDEALLAACRSQWEAFGMTADEARGIVEVWKPDLLGAPGIMVISRMPVPVFDKLFPLEISPKPSSVVRAPVVFDTLPGVAGRMEWLPGLKKQMDAWGKDLGHEEFEVRDKASRAFRRLGDLAQPVLEDLAKSQDPTVSAEAKALLAKLTPGHVEPLPVHGRSSKSSLVPSGNR